MESQNDTERGREKSKKEWNDMEDEKLVEAMLDIISSGSQFIADKGFNPEFCNAIERRLAVALPDSGIKAKPHIESRIKTLKNDWSTVQDMLSWNNMGGFEWDYENNMLYAPQPVWETYVQVHKNAGKWRGKKFPQYWDLCVIFGKDQANGRDAQTAADIVSEMDKQKEQDDHKKSIQRKRRRSNIWDPLILTSKETTEIICSRIEEAMKNLAEVLGTDRELLELRKNLNSEMKKVVGLTVRERMKAVRMLSCNEGLMVVFFTIDEEEKLGWVQDLLVDEV